MSRKLLYIASACVVCVFFVSVASLVSRRKAIHEHFDFAVSESVCNQTFHLDIPNVLTHDQCDLLIKASKDNGMKVSEVGEENQVLDTNVRKSTQTWFDQQANEVTRHISAVAMELAKKMEHCFGTITVADNFESIQVVQYGKDGKYDPHFDGTECGDDNKITCPANQRIATLLIYLNDDFVGGETRFPNMNNLKIKPVKGNAVFFWVSDPKTGLVYSDTLHGGDPVQEGEKWIATQWIRRKA